MTRIALIHALPQSQAPVADAFQRLWPEAELVNLLDDSLSRDRERCGGCTVEITGRILALARYALSLDADAILFTCSAFGEAIDAAARELAPTPVHKPNSAMIEEAVIAAGAGRIGLLASFRPTLQSMLPQFPQSQNLVTSACPQALQALADGDAEGHDQAAAAAAKRDLHGCAVIALAQFSLARAAERVSKATGLPVLTTPDSAVRALRVSMGRRDVRGA